MADEQKSNQAAIAGLVFILAIALFYFGIFAQGQAYHDVKLTADAKKVEAQALTNKVTALQTLQAKFANQKQDLQLLQTALPSTANPQEIIVMLDSIATKTGVNISNIQPSQKPTVGSTIPTADVMVTVDGAYSNQVAFEKAVENNVRPVILKSMTLVANASGSSLTGTYDLGFLIGSNSSVTGGLK